MGPHSAIAIHNRIGVGSGIGEKAGLTPGIFAPRTNDKTDASIVKCPFWTLLARSLGSSVEIILVPGTSHSELDSTAEFCLRTNLVIPEDFEVTNIVFYGDDGISSLSPNLNNDSETEEGRQSLGFVVKCREATTSELWILRYDEFLFWRFDFKRSSDNEVTIPARELDENNCIVLAMVFDEESDASSVVVPKRRCISIFLATTFLLNVFGDDAALPNENKAH